MERVSRRSLKLAGVRAELEPSGTWGQHPYSSLSTTLPPTKSSLGFEPSSPKVVSYCRDLSESGLRDVGQGEGVWG